MDLQIENIYKNHLAKPEETLYDHTTRLLENSKVLRDLGYIDEDLYEVLSLSCLYHDIGKISSLFQDRVSKGTDFNEREEVGHNILSAHLASYYVDVEKDKKDIIINAILNHHHYISNYSYILNNKELIKENLIPLASILEIDEKIYQEKVLTSLGDRKINRLEKNRRSKDYIKVKGLLNKCDYSASAHIDCEVKNDFLEKSLSNLDYNWNGMQEFCLENSDSNIMVVGSTGLGKTEASLLWAGNSKIFYLLPLRTAINAMYLRIKEKIVKTNIEDRIGLLHGETASFYIQESGQDMAEERLKFFTYYDRTKNLSLPLTVATPDQLFDFVFKYPGYELKLATFSYSKIIIDEIQAYSPDILAYTVNALNRINTLGGKFALFTATLAPFVKDLLLEEKIGESPIEFKEKTFLSNEKRHVMKVVEDRISSSYIVDILEKSKIKTGLIVMNTVKNAQRIYEELKEKIDHDKYEINLLHAKFIRKDRRKKEEIILKDGSLKGRQDNRKIKIWISTQIVEASLDIDFDILFTELSELLSLFQRMGRCFRKRLKKDLSPNVYVFTQIDDKHLTSPTKEKQGFIDRGLHFLSKEALLEKGDGLIDEEDKLAMINKYFTTGRVRNACNNSYLDKYRKTLNYIDSLTLEQKSKQEVAKEFRNIVSFKAIPSSVNIASISDEKSIANLKDDIEELISKMRKSKDDRERKHLRIELIKLKDKLEENTLNVEHYLVDFNSYIKVGNEKYYIIDIYYDKEYGLKKDDKDTSGGFLW